MSEIPDFGNTVIQTNGKGKGVAGIAYPVAIQHENTGSHSWSIEDRNKNTLCYCREEDMAKLIASELNRGWGFWKAQMQGKEQE